MAAAREEWHDAVTPALDPAEVVFLDETWARTNMTPTRGYAPKGERLVEAVPFRRWATLTLVAALGAAGLLAPRVLDGPVNGARFLAYVREVLVPCLRPGATVVMDNLRSHKVAGVREAVEGAGCRLLYLPPYSPDLNPIEMAFSKLKGLLRAAAERTAEGLRAALERLTGSVTPEDARNYIRHAGYTATPDRSPL